MDIICIYEKSQYCVMQFMLLLAQNKLKHFKK